MKKQDKVEEVNEATPKAEAKPQEEATPKAEVAPMSGADTAKFLYESQVKAEKSAKIAALKAELAELEK